ncbi:MAG: zinc ribbon domain-containing protein [Methylotenera sp.]|nr:zinc ribbon domain-containing protein [Oligoflexia bacterium]
MALYEYFCDDCQKKFEQITSPTDPDSGKCPKCNHKNTKKMISRFAVGGRGDLRESTLHGCHAEPDHNHADSHGHDHDHHGTDDSQTGHGED